MGLTLIARRERRKQIAEYIAAGHTSQQACRKFAVCPMTVCNACMDHNVGMRSRVKNRTLKIIAELLNTDDSCTKIGKRLGVSGTAIGYVMNRAIVAGIQIKRRGPGGEHRVGRHGYGRVRKPPGMC